MQLLCHPLFLIEELAHFLQLADAIADQNGVRTRRKHIGSLLFIVGGQVPGGERQGQLLGFSGRQKFGLLECPQLHPGHFQAAFGCGRIDLHHFPARHVSRIRHPDGNGDLLVIGYTVKRFQRERSIGQAEAKGVIDLLRRPGNGLKIPVAHKNIVGIADIVLRLVEIGGGRIVAKGGGKGVRQLAGGIDITAEDVRLRHGALHTALPGQQHGPDFGILYEPGGIHHAAHIQNNHDLVELGADLGNHLLFLRGEVEISVPRLTFPVPALRGKPADADNGGIAFRGSLLQKRRRDLRLHSIARLLARHPLARHIFPVECMQRGENLHLALGRLFFHTIAEVAHIGNRHVAAAAAAFHIVNTGLAKERRPTAAFQGQQLVFIFQQHHALRCRFPGQRDMRL